jgi:predicted TIM-barrel fold metal-dependent hydrolase
VARSPKRPGKSDLEWVERHQKDVTGIKVHPSLSRVRITDPAFQATFEVARDANLIVLVHCGRWQEMASYRFAIEAAVAHPKVRFLLAHAGGDTPPLASAAADMVADQKIKNVWFDFSGLREYWVIERNVKKIGAERYLMASDYCLAHPRMYIGAVEAMNLDARDKQKILGENACELFGRPAVGGGS